MAKLLAYLHLAMKQRALQAKLESALPGVEITAVGRIADFDRALASGTDAILTLPVILKSRGYAAELRGVRDGKVDEAYALVAEGESPNPKTVGRVGSLDLLGRSGTTKFVRDVLGASPRVDRVTKFEDLLPLLQMRRVDCILLPVRLLDDLRSMSRMRLARTELDVRVGLPAVAPVGAGAAVVLSSVRNLSRDVAVSLGVETWK